MLAKRLKIVLNLTWSAEVKAARMKLLIEKEAKAAGSGGRAAAAAA